MNRDSYNKIAQAWSAARTSFFGRERDYLEALLEATPKGASVLDLGCGTGCPMAQYVIAQGRHVIGVDQAEALLALARTSFPHEQWLLASIENYACQDDYASAMIWDSLFHIPRGEHEAILRKVVSGLPGGGRLMVTVGGSEHAAFTDTMFGESFYYDSNTPEQTEQILRRLGCRLVIAEFMNVPTGGRDKGRYAIVAEKA